MVACWKLAGSTDIGQRGLLRRHFSGGFREGGAIIAVVNADQQVTFFTAILSCTASCWI